MKVKEKQLLEYLKKHRPGWENATSGKQMKERFRVHEAELRELVHNLRMDGAPICSDRTGYFYPANAWEVTATVRHLRRMRDGVKKAICSLERATGAFRLPGGGEADRQTLPPLDRWEVAPVPLYFPVTLQEGAPSAGGLRQQRCGDPGLGRRVYPAPGV